MKSLIAWDKLMSNFENIESKSDISFLGSYLNNTNRYDIFEHIGLEDINNNKIYADSSILKVNYFSSSDWISDIGFFCFDDEDLRYVFHLIGKKEIVPFEAFLLIV